MAKLVEGDSQVAKLGVLKDLLKMSKDSMKDKLPKKGKGVAIMSVSVSKSKPKMEQHDAEMPHLSDAGDSEEVKEGGEMSGMDKFLPSMDEGEGAEKQMEKLGEESPEHEAEESSEEEQSEHEMEPKIPEDLMAMVKMLMMAKKSRK